MFERTRFCDGLSNNSKVVDFLLKQSDSYLCLQLLGVILALAGRSGTTEMPTGLLEKIGAIEQLFLGSDYEESQFNELKRFYRISSQGR